MYDSNTLLTGIKSGDVRALSKAITLVESRRPDHRRQAMELLNKLASHHLATFRVGITGIPGVGKSTFIERLGIQIISEGKKVAVLAIDPSSSRSEGSILGDKTRMEELSRNPNSFIRPSPSGGTLGGVASRTRECMLLCEAAGFDVVIVETVGVGQSETEVINMTDCFLMLAMPGTGDELQGIKRGIMETSDLIVVNKADGNNLDNAKKAKKEIEMALHLFPASDSGWPPKVMLASGLTNQGIEPCWENVKSRQQAIQENGWLEQNRRNQQQDAFQKLAELNLYDHMLQKQGLEELMQMLGQKVRDSKLNEFEASLALTEFLTKAD